VLGEVSGKRYARESFIAGYIKNKIVAPFRNKGTCDTILFNIWLEKYLIPELGPGYTVVLDNAKFHKSERTKEIIKQHYWDIVFLPPYSPDLNPIEKFWANLKSKVKNIIMKFSTLSEAIDHAFQSII